MGDYALTLAERVRALEVGQEALDGRVTQRFELDDVALKLKADSIKAWIAVVGVAAGMIGALLGIAAGIIGALLTRIK